MLEDGTYIYRNGELVNYGEKWAYGYIVAIRSYESLYGSNHPSTLDDNVLFGVWHDENGKRYTDIVEHVSDRAEALKRGSERGEIAIWDLRENKEIRL